MVPRLPFGQPNRDARLQRARLVDPGFAVARGPIANVELGVEAKKCSVDRNLQVLRRFFNWCIEQGLIAENPMRRVKFFRVETKRLRYLTEAEFARVLDAADLPRTPQWAEGWRCLRPGTESAST